MSYDDEDKAVLVNGLKKEQVENEKNYTLNGRGKCSTLGHDGAGVVLLGSRRWWYRTAINLKYVVSFAYGDSLEWYRQKLWRFIDADQNAVFAAQQDGQEGILPELSTMVKEQNNEGGLESGYMDFVARNWIESAASEITKEFCW